MARKAREPNTTETASPHRPTKLGLVADMLRRQDGATLGELCVATGWQAHSARAVLTGLRKKGHVIERLRRDDMACYRITQAA